MTWFEKKTDVPAKAMNTTVSVSKYSKAAWPEAESLKKPFSGTQKGYIPGKDVFNKKSGNYGHNNIKRLTRIESSRKRPKIQQDAIWTSPRGTAEKKLPVCSFYSEDKLGFFKGRVEPELCKNPSWFKAYAGGGEGTRAFRKRKRTTRPGHLLAEVMVRAGDKIADKGIRNKWNRLPSGFGGEKGRGEMPN